MRASAERRCTGRAAPNKGSKARSGPLNALSSASIEVRPRNFKSELPPRGRSM